MKQRKLLRIVFYLIIIYLVISSMYILSHIDFGSSSSLIKIGDSIPENANLIRAIMGLPKLTTTDQFVSKKYLIHIAVRMLIAIGLYAYNLSMMLKCGVLFLKQKKEIIAPQVQIQ